METRPLGRWPTPSGAASRDVDRTKDAASSGVEAEKGPEVNQRENLDDSMASGDSSDDELEAANSRELLRME